MNRPRLTTPIAILGRQCADYPDADAHALAVIDAALDLVDAAADLLTEETEGDRWSLSDARSALIGAAGMLDGSRDEERRARQRAAYLTVRQTVHGRYLVLDADGRPVTDRRHFDTRAALAECDDIDRMREQGIDLSALARARAVLETYARFGLTRITPGDPLPFDELMAQICRDLNHAAQHRETL